MKRKCCSISVYAAVCVCVAVCSVFGVTKYWNTGVELWNDGDNWSPTGVPTAGDDVVVTGGSAMAVVLNGDAECRVLDVSEGAFVIVNHSSRTLTVHSNATVSDVGSELRCNVGLLDVKGTTIATNGGWAVISDGGGGCTFKSHWIAFGTGSLVWEKGTLQLTDSIYVHSGSGWQGRTIEENQHLLLETEGVFGADLMVENGGVLTLDGGRITADGVYRYAGGTLNLDDGTFILNGADFNWGASDIAIEGRTPAAEVHMVLDGYYFPVLSQNVLLATGDHRRARLTLQDNVRLQGNTTIAGGTGSRADMTVDHSELQPTVCTIGSYGSGTLLITNNGSANTCQEIVVGRHSGSTGELVVAEGTSWSSYWKTYIGDYGVARMSARGGADITFDAQTQDALFGHHGGSEAHMLLTDEGSTMTVTPDSNQITIFGNAGHAWLTISNGAHATCKGFTVAGYHGGGRGDIVVTGPGSRWHVEDDVWLGYEGVGTLRVLDGATSIWDEGKLGEFPKGSGSIIVDGPGSYHHGGGYESIGGEFLVGRYGVALVIVTNGGTLESSGYSELGSYDGSKGVAIISGADSHWHASGSLDVGGGYYTHATGMVVITDGGYVSVHKGVVIGHNGTLMGDGTMKADVKNEYGHVRPGSSVGTLTLDGDFEQVADGTVHIEIAGTALSHYDRLVITGASTLAGTLVVTTDGYTPVSGDTFDVFDWVGGTTGMFDSVQLPSLGSGVQWSTNNLYTAGTLHVFPEPSAALAALGLAIAAVIRGRSRCQVR